MSPQYIKHAEADLTAQDPILGALIASQTLEPRGRREAYFASLCRSIIGQQVSVAAAMAIYGRFEAMTQLDPAKVAGLDPEAIKTIGLSRQKTGYLLDLAGHFVAEPAIYDHLDMLEDQAVIDELVAVKGIGVWTAQMFLMFTLLRPDVFAPDDVGLQKAVVRLYNLPAVPSKTELVAMAERWQPHRTIASWHLWQSLNNTPA